MKSQTFYKILCGILLAIVGFIGTQIYNKNLEIQKDLIDIKISLTKLQSQQLTKDDVKEICKIEFFNYSSLSQKAYKK